MSCLKPKGGRGGLGRRPAHGERYDLAMDVPSLSDARASTVLTDRGQHGQVLTLNDNH
jgi:hypothetical protein